jgi:hypothetical protein
MTHLKLNNEHRYESSIPIIDNLIRKGWTIVAEPPDPPTYDASIHKLIYNASTNDYSVIELSSEELANNARAELVMFVESKIEEGFLVEPENFRLNLRDSDRAIFAQMLALVKEALDLNFINDDTLHTITDKEGIKREVTTLRFRQIMVAYGFYYKGLWDMLVS